MAGSFLNGNLVKADVIWEPPKSEFMEEHRKECSYENREYITMGKNGHVSAYVDPLSDKEAVKISNNEHVRVMYRYTDSKKGKAWGMISEGLRYTSHNEVLWVEMAELKLVYDHIEFCKDHKSELQPMDDRFDGKWEEVYCSLWTYPNSGISTGHICYQLGQGLEYLYVDEYGRTWSYICYYRGQKGWICLDDLEIGMISPEPSVSASLLPTGTQEVKTSEPAIFLVPTPEPVPTSSIMPTEVPVPVKTLQCRFEAVNTWKGGFIGQFTITNKGKKTVKNWKASFSSDYEISSLWGAKLVSNKDGACFVSNESWDTGIEPGDSRCFSFIAQGDYKDTLWDIDAVALD